MSVKHWSCLAAIGLAGIIIISAICGALVYWLNQEPAETEDPYRPFDIRRFKQLFRESEFDTMVRNYYARDATLAEKYETAWDQFDIIGDDWSEQAWYTRSRFEWFRQKARRNS